MPAGFPSTKNLTQSILCGYGVHRHTDTRYRYISDPNLAVKLQGVHHEHDNFVIISKFMAKWFYEQAQKYYSEVKQSNRQANYEDIFYLADQVYADEWEIENPAVHSFVSEKKEYFTYLFANISNTTL